MEKTGGCRWIVVAAFVLAALLWPAGASANGAVGLEARGVDPWASLRNRWGLDVRDEMNRPVSAAIIEAGLKAASASAAQETAFASRLPSAGLHIRLAEMLAALKDMLKPVSPRSEVRRVSALPAPGMLRLYSLFLTIVSVPMFSPRAAAARAQAVPAQPSRLALVLRC